MNDRDQKIQQLKEYFEKREDVVMAFLFGSQASGRIHKESDWDVAVYVTPDRYGELEISRDIPYTKEIWNDVERIVKTNVDLLVLNRARPPLVFSVLNHGVSLVIKDRLLYVRLLLKTHYEAVDFWHFVYDFWKIRERSRSLSPEDRAALIEHLVFLENELKDIEQFEIMRWEQYADDRNARRNIERWVENLVMAAIDIGKIILAAEKKDVPHTYKDALRALGGFFADEKFAEEISQYADLRNIVAHEYLDYRWDSIQKFVINAKRHYPLLIQKIKEYAHI